MPEIPQDKYPKILKQQQQQQQIMLLWNYCQSFWGNSPRFHPNPFDFLNFCKGPPFRQIHSRCFPTQRIEKISIKARFKS